MKKKKISKFNIFFVLLLLVTIVSTTYSWILIVNPIEAPGVEYTHRMVISPSSVSVRMTYGDGDDAQVVSNDSHDPLFTLDDILPGKLYDFYLYLSNEGTREQTVSLYFDGIHANADVDGISLKDVLWISVEMESGYDPTLMQPTSEFKKLNDEERLTYKQSTDTYQFTILQRSTLYPIATYGEAKFKISIMIDTTADIRYSGKELQIDSIRVEG